MKTIVHDYEIKNSFMPKIKEYQVEEVELQKILMDLSFKHTNRITITRESVDCNGNKTTTTTQEIEKTPILVTEIDDAVERAYPDIGDIPESPDYALREYTNCKNANKNVWLDASLEVEKELERIGYQVIY